MADKKEYRPRQTNGNKVKAQHCLCPILPPAYSQVIEDEIAEKERISEQFDLQFWET